MSKSKKESGHFIVKLDIYQFDILVSYNQTDEEVFSLLEQYGIEKSDMEDHVAMEENCRGRTISFKNGQTMIRLKSTTSPIELSGVIVHEAFHAATMILHKIGTVFEVGISDEPYAYLLQYITTRIFKKISKYI